MLLLMHKYKILKTKEILIIFIWNHVLLKRDWSMVSFTVERQSSGWVLYLRLLGCFNFLLHKQVEQNVFVEDKTSKEQKELQSFVGRLKIIRRPLPQM